MTEVLKALQRFFAGFGIAAYQENSVPLDAVFPYITYSPVVTGWDGEAVLPVRVWDYGGPNFSPARLAGIVDDMAETLGEGLTLTAGSHKYVHLAKGSPWVQLQPMQDTDVRVAYLNFEISTLV